MDETSQTPMVVPMREEPARAAPPSPVSSRGSQKTVSLEGSIRPLILCTAMARFPGWLNMNQFYAKHEVALAEGKLYVGKRSMRMRTAHWYDKTFELSITGPSGLQVFLRFPTVAEFKQFRDTLFDPEQWAWAQDGLNSARLLSVPELGAQRPDDVVAIQVNV